MAKNRSSELFELIKSLSKSEKRYFRMAQSAERDQKYLRLFELLVDQKVFDDTEILELDQSFDPTQFSNLKAHLYQKLLRSLRDFSLPSLPSVQIRELIDEAQILFNKGFYHHCAKRLLKAEKLAISSDNPEMQLVILKWRKQMIIHTLDKSSEGQVEEVVAKVTEVNNRINNINTFSNLQMRLQSVYRKTGYIRNEKEFKKIEQTFRSNLPNFVEEELSVTEKIHLYHLLIGYFFFTQDFYRGYEYAKKWVALFDQQKALQRSKLEQYIDGLNFLLISQQKLEKRKEFLETRRELRGLNQLPARYYNENIRIKMLKYTFVHEFNRLFLTGEFDRGVELIERLESGLEAFIAQLDAHSRVIMFYKTACLYFGNSDFQKAVFWLNKILTLKNVDLREDIHGFARILNLISHYELENIELIEHYVRSTYRFLFKKEEFHQYQRLILRFLKGLNPQVTPTEVIDRFKILRTKMLNLQRSPFEKRAFVYFDMVSWLESRIDGRPIMNVIQDKSIIN